MIGEYIKFWLPLCGSRCLDESELWLVRKLLSLRRPLHADVVHAECEELKARADHDQARVISLMFFGLRVEVLEHERLLQMRQRL